LFFFGHIWQTEEQIINYAEFMDRVAASAPSIGHCNTMGTALSLNSMAEALGMSLPACAAIPAPYRERSQIAYETGHRSVALVKEEVTPREIMTKPAFENAIMVASAIAASTSVSIHVNAIARHVGVELCNQDWQRIGGDIPVLTNVQPAGEFLGEDFYRAGGVPAVMYELLTAGTSGAGRLGNRYGASVDESLVFFPSAGLRERSLSERDPSESNSGRTIRFSINPRSSGRKCGPFHSMNSSKVRTISSSNRRLLRKPIICSTGKLCGE
jgi:dihydroxy-acid dehydratase